MRIRTDVAGQRLASGERGLVVSPPIKIEGTTFASEGVRLDLQELRSSLLFWDKLDFPQNRVIHIALSPDEKFLVDEGVLQRSSVQPLESVDAAEFYLEAQLATFRALEKRDQGSWSMAHGERSISFPPREALKDAGLTFELHHCIPVPDRVVPLAEVLEFKRKRYPELIALRNSLEETCRQIIADPARPASDLEHIADLDRRIADHVKVSNEIRFPLRLSGLKASLSLDVSSPIFVGIAASLAGLPFVDACLVGAAAFLPKLVLKSDIGLAGRKASPTPFQYVSSFHRDLYGVKAKTD